MYISKKKFIFKGLNTRDIHILCTCVRACVHIWKKYNILFILPTFSILLIIILHIFFIFIN